MKIKVEYPFDAEFTRAYLSRSNLDFRQRVTLHRPDETGTIISYARYLMSVKLGRFLTDDEEVDHINTDPTDDSIENLQVLSVIEHKIKSAKEVECKKDELVCTNCSKIFLRPSSILLYKNPKNVFCSHSCNGKYHANSEHSNLGSNNKKITDDDIEKIKQMMVDGYTGYRISKEIRKVGTSSTMRWIRIIEEKYGVKYKHWK